MTRSHPDNAVQKRQRRARLLHSIYTWHRWLGLSALLWVLLFSISGLLIEASPALGLDKRSIQNELLLTRYGISQPTFIQSWNGKGWQLQQWDQGATFNSQWLGNMPKPPVAAAEYLGLVVVATENQILLFDQNGLAVDSIGSPSGKIIALGKTLSGAIAVGSGSKSFVADADLLNWTEARNEEINWITPSTSALNTQAPTPKHDISYERLLLDIHSGALFGPVGRWLSRLAAVVMILLAISGFYTWFSRFARRPH